MTPGTIIVDTPADEAVKKFMADDLVDIVVVLEALASDDDELLRIAGSRFKALVAAMAAHLGLPSETPTRKQGISNPPATIDPRWTSAAVWRTSNETLVATLSGPQGGAHEVSLCRSGA